MLRHIIMALPLTIAIAAACSVAPEGESSTESEQSAARGPIGKADLSGTCQAGSVDHYGLQLRSQQIDLH